MTESLRLGKTSKISTTLFTTSPCPQVLHPCHRCSLCSNPVELSSELLILSSLTCQPRCVLNAKTRKDSLFLSYKKEISPRVRKITLFAWLVPATFLHMGLAARAASDAKTILIPTLKNAPKQPKDNTSPLRTMARA